MKVFIIAEAACTWLHGGLEAACRSIKAAKDCGADAWKTQWTSDSVAMHKRRGIEGDHYKRLAWPREWLSLLKAKCDEVGIGFLCTVFIEKDLSVIAKYVKFIKVSGFEAEDWSFMQAAAGEERSLIVSVRYGAMRLRPCPDVNFLYVVSEYPTPLENLHLLKMGKHDGFSCHTPDIRVGGWAVAAGARIVESHVRLSDTPSDDPDYRHSFTLDSVWSTKDDALFAGFVKNIRDCEVAL